MVRVVALVSGDAIPDESHKLLESVHYESDLVSIPAAGRVRGIEDQPATAGHRRPLSSSDRIAAILLGLFLGGGRALYRIARGQPASSVYDAEFISLDLKD